MASKALKRFEHLAAAKNLAALEGDKKLLLDLGLREFTGPHWAKFAMALAEYGYPVVRAWVRSGKVFTECRRKGCPVSRGPAAIASDDASELANETVAKAIHEFRKKVLIPGRWDPTKKATLRTYFVGQCVLQFPNIYRAWVKEQPELLPEGLTGMLEQFGPEKAISGEVAVEAARALEALSVEDPLVIEVAMDIGRSQDEIADGLNTTVRGVQSRLYRFRQRRGGA